MPSNTPLPAAEFRRLEGNLIEYAVAVLDDPGNMLAHATLEIALDELKDALAASPRTLAETLHEKHHCPRAKSEGGREVKRWRCKSCDQITIHDGLLTGPSPFDKDDLLVGCPNCKQCAEGFSLVCDEPECGMDASCGYPTDGGYRQTCYTHWQKGGAK